MWAQFWVGTCVSFQNNVCTWFQEWFFFGRWSFPYLLERSFFSFGLLNGSNELLCPRGACKNSSDYCAAWCPRRLARTQLSLLSKRHFSIRETLLKGNLYLFLYIPFLTVECLVCWLIWWTCLFFYSVVFAVGSTDSLILMQNRIQTSLRCTYQWGWRATFIACTWMKYAVETTNCILLAQLGSTLCVASACPTPESACVPQVNVSTSQSGILFSVQTNIGA